MNNYKVARANEITGRVEVLVTGLTMEQARAYVRNAISDIFYTYYIVKP